MELGFNVGRGDWRRRSSYAALFAILPLLTSACDAQPAHRPMVPGKLPATGASITIGSSSPKTSVHGELNNEAPFNEPALTGKIVDAKTQQPIAGAFVYGFYATHGGGTLAGGSKMGQHVKSFLAVTDANGQYRLEGWSTGNQPISGTRGTKFPMMAIYKPGYDLWFDQMSTIAQYRPKSGIAGTEVEIRDGVRDWTKYPHRLVPLSKEQDRYAALSNSNYPMLMAGECGWQVYAPLLLAQHNEFKRWIQAVVPVEHRDKSGYGKASWGHPDPMIRGYSNWTTVDKLKRTYSDAPFTGKCANPHSVFAKASQ